MTSCFFTVSASTAIFFNILLTINYVFTTNCCKIASNYYSLVYNKNSKVFNILLPRVLGSYFEGSQLVLSFARLLTSSITQRPNHPRDVE